MPSARFLLAICFVMLQCSGVLNRRMLNSASAPQPADEFSVQTSRHRSEKGEQEDLSRLLSCHADKNEFLKHLISHKVRILNKPDKLSGKCGEEWAKFGTCCEVGSLIRYAEAQSKSLLDSTTTFSSDIKKLINCTLEGSSSLTQQITAELAAEEDTSDKPQGDKDAPKKPEQETDRKLLLGVGKGAFKMFAKFTMTRVREMASIVSMLKTNIQPFFESQNKCISKLNAIRSSSLCNTCSARSQVFFTQGKIRMSLDDCKQVIGECKSYWSTLLKNVDSLESVKEVIEEIREKEQENTEMFKGKHHSNLLKWIEENKLKEHLSKCADDDACDGTVAADLCASLISIRQKDPLMTTSSHSFENRIKKTSSIFRYTNIYLSTRKTRTDVAAMAQRKAVSLMSSMFRSSTSSSTASIAPRLSTSTVRKLIGLSDHHSHHYLTAEAPTSPLPSAVTPLPAPDDSLKPSPPPQKPLFRTSNPEVTVIPNSSLNYSTLDRGSTVMNLQYKMP